MAQMASAEHHDMIEAFPVDRADQPFGVGVETAIGFELEALMHDAAEAFLGDITRPLKQMLPDYKRIESETERAIFSRFGIQRLNMCGSSDRD